MLCYDSLGKTVRYAAATRLKVDAKKMEWFTFALSDGAELKMTADHPVHLAPQAGA